MIPYGHQDIDEKDIEAVLAVLRSDFLTQGPAIEQFETEVAKRCGVPYAVAVSSATAALHLANLALGMGPGRIGWTSPNTFVASANAYLYCGGDVDFVDIDPHTWNLSPESLEAKLLEAEKVGRLPHVVTPVHFGGQSCEMDKIGALAQRYGFSVIEDASHAIGATYQGEAVGCCRYSDITVFSFHPVKIITTGEGGMILTRRRDLYEALIRLRTHGITRDATQLENKTEGPWYYEQQHLGYNYRMTDMQATLGRSQLDRLDQFVERRTQLVNRYNEALANCACTSQAQIPNQSSAHHLYVLAVPPKRRLEIFNSLREAGVGVNVHYIPVHLQPYYRNLGFSEGNFPHAEEYYKSVITVPLYPKLQDKQQDVVVEALTSMLKFD